MIKHTEDSLVQKVNPRVLWLRLSDGLFVPIRRFWRVYSSVLIEGMRDPAQRRRAVPLWIFEFTAAACQGLVIATLAYGVRLASQQADHTSDFLIENLPFLKGLVSGGGAPQTILAGTVVLCSIFLTGSVVARYLSAVIARRMGRSFHRRLTASVIALGNEGRLVPVDHIKSKREMHFAAVRNAIHVSKAFAILVTIVPTAIYCVFFYAVTFTLIWEVSAIIALAIALLLPVCLRVSRRIHSFASSYFNLHAQRFGGQIGAVIAGMDAYFAPTLSAETATSSKQKEDVVYDSYAEEYFDHFDAIQLASARMGFMTGLVKAFIFSVGLASLCIFALLKQLDYFVIISFATALFVSFNFMQNLLSNLATMNVFYPQVSAFYALTKAWQTGSPFDPQRAAGMPDTSDELCVFRSLGPKGAFAGVRLACVEVPPGSVIDLVTASPIGRFNVKHWLEPLTKASEHGIYSDHVVLFNAKMIDLSPLTLAELDSALEQRTGRRLWEVAAALSLQESVGEWLGIQSPEATLELDSNALAQTSADVRCVLYIAAAMASRAKYIFLDGGLLKAKSSSAVRDLFADRIVFVWRTAAVGSVIKPDWRFLIKDGKLAVILPKDSDPTLIRDFYPEVESAAGSDVDDISILD